MSRLKRYAQSLASGYLLMVANTLYTFAAVPLALHYLSKAEFGLWALTTQVLGYVVLLDLGVSGATKRILIDYKDDKENSRYGSVILTSVAVNAAHAVLVLAGGLLGAQLLPALLKVPPELAGTFRWLMMWQTLVVAFTVAYRTPAMILQAHQRYDLVNATQALLCAANFGVLWFCFAKGLGVFSMVWSQAAGTVPLCAVALAGCWRLKLLPQRGHWGRPARAAFRELFGLGRDMFLYTLGNLFINASQTILITRVLGLDANAIWTVCTRVFALATQFLSRIAEYSWAALAEMIVRGERVWLLRRFRSMVMVSASLSVCCGAGLAVGNQSFVVWWTAGKIGWPAVNDVLLAAWLLVLVLVRFHTGLIGLRKQFQFLRYLYFLEGVVAVAAGYVALKLGGITWMLAASLMASVAISLPYSAWRTCDYFGLTMRQVAWDWLAPALRVALCLAPLGLAVMWLTRSLPAPTQLAIRAGVIGLAGVVALARFGLDDDIRREAARRVPARLGWVRRVLGVPRQNGAPVGARF